MDGELSIFIMQILLNFGIYLIVTLSLNLEVGFLGLPQFGRVLTVLMGAIVAGGISGRIIAFYLGFPWGMEYTGYDNYRIVSEISDILANNPLLSLQYLIMTLILAALLGGLIGYLTAYPALRLKEAYLGITLLAFGDIMNTIAWNFEPLAGGTTGVLVPDPFRFLGGYRFVGAVAIILAIAILVYVYVEYLTRSPYGRVLRAVRDSEVAAVVYGKSITSLRRNTLIIGGALAAIGGALWSMYTGSFKAVTYTRLVWTFWPWAFMMLGGTGNNFGVLLGVLIFSIARTFIIVYKGLISTYLMISPEWLEYILVGLVIVLLVLFRPQGIIPEKPLSTLGRKEINRLVEESLGRTERK